MPGETTWRYSPGRLLQCYSLVVPVHSLRGVSLLSTNAELETYLFGVDREWPPAFTVGAVTDFHFAGRILVKWAEDCTTFAAIKLNVLQLREDTGATSDNARYSNKGVEIRPPEVPKRNCYREIRHADMHVGMYPLVRRIIDQNSTKRDLVKDSQHGSGTIEEEVSDDGFGVGKVQVRHLQRLGVIYIQVRYEDNNTLLVNSLSPR